jgi:hypothetical protein
MNRSGKDAVCAGLIGVAFDSVVIQVLGSHSNHSRTENFEAVGANEESNDLHRYDPRLLEVLHGIDLLLAVRADGFLAVVFNS